MQDADKKGLPRILDSIIVSSKTRYNIRNLCNSIYTAAFEQRSTGSKERILEQKIPASYLALEEVPHYILRCLWNFLSMSFQAVGMLADERKARGKDPVLSGDEYRQHTQQLVLQKFNKHFRDLAELNQATAFLHENG